MSPTGDGTAILHGHPCQTKVQSFAVQMAGKPSLLSYFKTMSIGAAP